MYKGIIIINAVTCLVKRKNRHIKFTDFIYFVIKIEREHYRTKVNISVRY